MHVQQRILTFWCISNITFSFQGRTQMYEAYFVSKTNRTYPKFQVKTTKSGSDAGYVRCGREVPTLPPFLLSSLNPSSPLPPTCRMHPPTSWPWTCSRSRPKSSSHSQSLNTTARYIHHHDNCCAIVFQLIFPKPKMSWMHYVCRIGLLCHWITQST